MERGFKLYKSMGQNFLVDGNIPKKIVQKSNLDKSCGVLEVGPGLGALTRELSSAAGYVAAVEKDARLIPILHDIFSGHDNVSIVQGDILKLDIRKLVEETMHGVTPNICANLPYNITTPAITAFIESRIFNTITIMVQKEVALRICAKPGTPEYGAFTVFTNFYTEPEILFDVSPNCFTPRPKVTSSVVKMVTRSELSMDAEREKAFFKVVRAAFGQRRKTLINALYAVYAETYSKDAITDIVISCGLHVHTRGETLGIEEFERLSENF